MPPSLTVPVSNTIVENTREGEDAEHVVCIWKVLTGDKDAAGLAQKV